MDGWERKLATRDTNRVVRPFEWGTDWLHRIDPNCSSAANGDARASVERFAAAALEASDGFYSYPPPADFLLQGNHLTFTSAVSSGYTENDTVHALWFPAPKDEGRALVVLPQWNAGADGHVGLAKLLNRFGISALRMSMAYHAERMPRELERADYHVSSNIGRTIHAVRQSVVDVRACLDWLGQQGYRRMGLLGTSLGSCVACIAAAHDRRVQTGIFNHVSMYFSDVVWTGLPTQHVRRGFGDQVSQDELRRYWSVISPAPAGPGHPFAADLGAPRQQLPACLLPTGVEELSRVGLASRSAGLALWPLHHRTIPLQPRGRSGDVPVRGA